MKRVLAWLPLALALAGVGIAIVVVREHAAVVEGGIARGLFCGGGGRFDCSAVASHQTSWLLGVPLAVWGLLFYVATAGLAVAALALGRGRARAAELGLLLAVAAVVFDLYLAWTMVFQIGAICLNCVATYAINLLLVIAWWLRERQLRGEAAEAPRTAPAWAAPAIAVATLAALGVAGWLSWSPIGLTQRFAREETDEFLAQLDGPPAIDMSRFAGQPARGPENAPVRIAVMGDFQCHYCRALAAHVERLQERHRDRLRVWFVNAPVNSRCHPMIHTEAHEDACWLADAAECAAAAGKFWEYHDLLYHTIPHPQVTAATVAQRVAEIGLDPAAVRACVESGQGRAAMAADTTILRELALDSVPALVINGYVERGGIYPEALTDIVQALLRRQ
jgi:uncharacterized membrane protein/protein-disulfide isomerase